MLRSWLSLRISGIDAHWIEVMMKRIRYAQFVRQQLGVFVPVRSLRSWVVGLPEPKSSFIKTNNGFKQAEWMIEYDQMQKINDYLLPHKITVTNPKVKLKLIIDQWDLNDARAE